MLNLKEAVHEISTSTLPYYIYVLYKPCGTPFYVGKGTVRTSDSWRGCERIENHEREAKRNRPYVSMPYLNNLKLNTIRKIWRQDQEVLYIIDSWYDEEKLAYKRERELILSIGRQIVGTGPLTNLTEGGEGEMSTITDETRQQISNSLKQYYKDNPKALEEMSKRTKQYFIDNPEAIEKMRENNIKNNYSKNIIKWLETAPEEVLREKWDKHAEWLKEWNQTEEGKEVTRKAAIKRNEKIRTEEHRKHMAAATAKYIRENPEADAARRARVKETNEVKKKIKEECYQMIYNDLINTGKLEKRKVVVLNINNWKNRLSPEVLAIVNRGDYSIEGWKTKKKLLAEHYRI